MAADGLALGELAGDRVHRVRARDVERVTPGGHAQATGARAAACRLGECEHAHIRRAGHEAGGFGRVVDDLESLGSRSRLKSERWLYGHLVRRREAAQQLAELEPVEHGAHLVVVVAGPARALEVQLDRDVTDDRDHPLAEPDLVGVLFEGLLQPSLRQLLDALEDCLHRPEVLDELGGGLVADAGHPGDVVGRVPPQRLEVDQLRRLEAIALPDLVGSVHECVRDPAPGHQSLH